MNIDMKNLIFKDLLERYLDDSLSEKELIKLFKDLNRRKNTEELQQIIENAENALTNNEFSGLADTRRKDIVFQRLMLAAKECNDELIDGASEFEITSRLKIPVWIRLVAAASIVILITAGTYFWISSNSRKDFTTTDIASAHFKNDIAPGSNKAVLTLDDGSTIILDDVHKGVIAHQSNTKVVKLADGQLAYNAIKAKPSQILYNTITTPRGGQYKLVLPDGSRVLLNAASSIRFPVAFVGNERKVDITGEVYFEVTKDKSRPFKVSVNDMNIEVLGTHFNVMAYDNESLIKTTLLEGTVKVSKDEIQTVLSPGEQAQLDNQGKIKVDKNVNITETVAWMNGWFIFNSEKIEDIMRQVSRWYDVDVVYEGKIINETFTGMVSRNSNVSQVLKIMEEAGIKFKIEGRRIIVK
jgi:ferric-dicitrate binding protein FerR (iron transport regulator)